MDRMSMQRISSKSTFVSKRVFPIFWFGFLALFVVIAVFARTSARELLPFVIVPAIMAVGGYFVMKRLVFDLVDEVWDGGDFLLIKSKGEQERIPLDAIVNVSFSAASSPQRATLKLRTPGRFGSEVSFLPVAGFFPFGRNEVIDRLIERIDAARRGVRV